MRSTPRAMPFGCLALSVLIVLAFLVAHLAGLREHVGLLSGSAPGSEATATLGLLYVLSWFSAVLVAPVLALAAVLRVVAHHVAALLSHRSAPEAPRARLSGIPRTAPVVPSKNAVEGVGEGR